VSKELLSFNDLSAFGISYSRPHVYKLMKAGAFPKQIRIGPKRVAWRLEDIRKHIDSLNVA
jgi:prophage regulatory protein